MYKLFLFFVTFTWLGFLLALFGVFHSWILLGWTGIFWATTLLPKPRETLTRLYITHKKEFFFVGCFIMFLVIILATKTPTIFNGRDQGSISNAAILLANNHSLETTTQVSTTFFEIYGEGKALNFPGFFYTETGALTSQFPVPAISWYASFFSFFETYGFFVANGITLSIFFLTLLLLLKELTKTSPSLQNLKTKHLLPSLSALLLLTLTPFVWFFSFTLSELLALSLFWLFVLSVVSLQKNSSLLTQKQGYTLALLTGSLLIFTRIEALVIVPIGFLFVLLSKKGFAIIQKNPFVYLVLPLITFLILFGVNAEATLSFYKTLAKALLGLEGGAGVSQSFLSKFTDRSTLFITYGLLPFIILAIPVFIKMWQKKDWAFLLPFVILLPACVYLIDPNISHDHPWMLRRFFFAVTPILVILSSVLILSTYERKPFFGLILLSGVLTFTLPPTVHFLLFSPNKNLDTQITKIVEPFPQDALILMDREVTGDGFSMAAGPLQTLHNKNTVYFFNPDDFEKIDTSPYSAVYLITPNSNASFWLKSSIGQNLKEESTYSIQTNRLHPADTKTFTPLLLPRKETISVTGTIYKITP